MVEGDTESVGGGKEKDGVIIFYLKIKICV